ncbi:hypothetical protein ACROYT_G007950 [Oculina patagonica]
MKSNINLTRVFDTLTETSAQTQSCVPSLARKGFKVFTMQKIYLAIIVFCATISVAYTFMCYQCVRKETGKGEYTKEQCEKDQKIVDCTNRDPNATDHDEYTCVSMYSESEDGKEYLMKACYLKSVCEEMKKKCEDTKKMKELKLKECTMTCCVSDGDKPCNSGYTVSTNVIIMTFSVLISVKLF